MQQHNAKCFEIVCIYVSIYRVYTDDDDGYSFFIAECFMGTPLCGIKGKMKSIMEK